MKQFLSIIILVILLVSCGSKSGNRVPRTQVVAQNTTEDRNVPFRARYTWISETTFNRYVSDEVEIIKADSAFRSGDTIRLSGRQYILEQRTR